MLNVLEYKKLEDKVSTIFIFKLKPQMYTMSDVHHIGLKNFDDAYLIVEFISENIILARRLIWAGQKQCPT